MKFNIYFLSAVFLFVNANNALEVDLKCFVQGECTLSENIEIVSADDELKCLDRCQTKFNCTWFTFYPNSETCQLFSNCKNIEESFCPLCISGQKDCPDPICGKQGMLTNNFSVLFIGN